MQIRFGHAVPVPNHVDAEIVQEEDATIRYFFCILLLLVLFVAEIVVT